VTVGTIEGGSRHNIVPDQVRMSGTIRTFDPEMRKEILARVKRTVEGIASAAGATAELILDEGYPVTWNDPALTERMTPSLKRVAAGTFNPNAQPTTTSEDFSFYGQKAPALYFFLGVAPKGADPAAWAANHSPRFSPDEAALITGVRALASLAVDFLAGK
jgi:amidohydrolase